MARCLSGPSAEESLAPCERDIHVGDDLSLSYRFPAELLKDWQALDQAVQGQAEKDDPDRQEIAVEPLPQPRSMSRIAIEKLYDRSPSSSSLKMMPRNSSPR